MNDIPIFLIEMPILLMKIPL